MATLDKQLINEFNSTRHNPKYLCNAPFCSMYFSMSGQVSPCCRNTTLHDVYPQHSLKDIWNGAVFKEYRKNIKSNFLADSCSFCEGRLRNKDFENIIIHQYDLDIFKIKKLGKNNIQSVHIALGNTCNLKCIMCNEMFSSQYENVDTYNRAKIYDDKFVEELLKLAPDLKELICYGGETFLIEDFYKIWERIINVNPTCKISILTNGTIWNDRVENILKRGNFSINFSCDSITKSTYEQIRRNANFETTMQNLDRYANIMKSQGKRLQMLALGLKANCKEIPDIVRFCNEKELGMVFLTIVRAMDVALWDLPSEELKDLKEFYKQQKISAFDENSKENLRRYNIFVSNMDLWIADAQRKENFKNIFDLKSNMVGELKKHLFEELEKEIKVLSCDEADFAKRKNFIETKFNGIMNSLPDYFDTNHFYNLLNKMSPNIIIEHLELCNSNSVAKIFEELFFYCGVAH